MRKFSNFLKLNTGDIFRGLVLAVLAAALVPIQDTINTGSFKFNWPLIAKVAATAGLAYIVKNWLTNNRGSFAETDPK